MRVRKCFGRQMQMKYWLLSSLWGIWYSSGKHMSWSTRITTRFAVFCNWIIEFVLECNIKADFSSMCVLEIIFDMSFMSDFYRTVWFRMISTSNTFSLWSGLKHAWTEKILVENVLILDFNRDLDLWANVSVMVFQI